MVHGKGQDLPWNATDSSGCQCNQITVAVSFGGLILPRGLDFYVLPRQQPNVDTARPPGDPSNEIKRLYD